jgi:abortive infection bacteriophage resistance protein
MHGRFLCASAYESALSFCVLPPYSKPYLSIEDQIALLKKRGMGIPDSRQAAEWLCRIGYYRLSGYWYPFRERTDIEVLETFLPGTELSHAFDLYVFDKRLRMLILDAIERVEVGLRVDIALEVGQAGPWAHRDPGNFNGYFRTIDPKRLISRHNVWLEHLESLSDRSRDEFAKHFRVKYSGPFPLWIAIELWDFGALSQLLNGLHDRHLQPLTEKYNLPRRNMLVSWIQTLNFVRNVSAHHGRMWNRPLVNQPAPPKSNELPLLQHWLSQPHTNTRIYAAASVLQYFLRTMNPRSSWGARLKSLVGEFPGGPGLTLSSGGFPAGWGEQELWQRVASTTQNGSSTV